MASNDIFEKESVSSAIIKLAIPTIVSSLVTVIYNLADTYFVGLLNDPVQTAAVTLAAPALLAFNAINNLFGVGTSSAMSRALGRGDSNLVRRCSVFGLYCAFISSVLFSVFTGLFRTPLLGLLGASAKNAAATSEYMRWAVTCGAVPSILNVVFAFLVILKAFRGEPMYDILAMYETTLAGFYIYKYKMEKKKKDLFLAICWGMTTIINLYLAIWRH